MPSILYGVSGLDIRTNLSSRCNRLKTNLEFTPEFKY